MNDSQQKVFVVDDDEAVRDSLSMLFQSVGLKAETYSSADSFLSTYSDAMAGCLILDIRMPGMNGIELQQELVRRRASVPIIFITGHGDVPMAVQAMQDGATDFIQKPFRDQDLLDRVQKSLLDDQSFRISLARKQEIEAKFEKLTEREQQVLELILQGLANKTIAEDLSLSQRTVEVHRSRIMEKMGTRSIAQLVRMIDKITT